LTIAILRVRNVDVGSMHGGLVCIVIVEVRKLTRERGGYSLLRKAQRKCLRINSAEQWDRVKRITNLHNSPKKRGANMEWEVNRHFFSSEMPAVVLIVML
jgi:hypothetical protein